MYRRVVVALDGSPVAEAVIPFMLQIAGPLDMEVVLVRVNQPVPTMVTDGAIPFTVENPEEARIDAEEYLKPIASELHDKGVRAETQVRRGQPAEEIVAAARETGADLIAMTTHGRSGLGRLLFGSVAESVLRESRLPVFLMRVTEAEVARRAAQGAAR